MLRGILPTLRASFRSPEESSEIQLPTFPAQTFLLRVSVYQGSSTLREPGSLVFILGLQRSWGGDAGLAQRARDKAREAAQAEEAGSFPEAPESGLQCVTSLCWFKCKHPQPDLQVHMQM